MRGKKNMLIFFFVVVLLCLFFLSEEHKKSEAQTSEVAESLQTNNPTEGMNDETSGLKIEILSSGTGPGALNGQTVVVDYTGTFLDGTVFDSSIPRGQPFPVRLGAGEVIRGWDLGLLGMKVGEKRRLTIAPELAYGKDGFSGVIPPNATLVFDIILKEIK